MAHRRKQRVAMVAAGLATAVTPFVLGQGAAHAAQTGDSDERTLSFFHNDGTLYSCTTNLIASHDTDDPNRPELSFFSFISGGSGCTDVIVVTSVATYRDASGHVQRATTSGGTPLAGLYENAHSGTSVSLRVDFRNCDDTRGTACRVDLTASPK